MYICIFTYTVILLMFCFFADDKRPYFKWNIDTYGDRSHMYILQLFNWIIFCFVDSNNCWAWSWVSSNRHLLFIFKAICIFTYTVILLMFCFFADDKRPYFKWNIDTYGDRSHMYILQLFNWILFCFVDSNHCWAWSWVSSNRHLLFILLRLNPYILNLYILDQNSRLPSHTIYVA